MIAQAIILGIVQGITEMLPVSSSGHLYLLSHFFFDWNISESFDIALHFGTLIAICIYFFKDWINLFKGGFKLAFKHEDTQDGKLFWYLVIATIPVGILGLFFEDFLDAKLTHPLVIGGAFIIMGMLLYYIDKISKSEINLEKLNFGRAFAIGISQILAFVPGVSRSGVTITTGRLLKVDRESAAKYSFLLSTPVVFAATILKLKEFEFSIAFFAGVITSFIVGLLVIKALMNYLKKGSFKGFAIYRVALGLIVYETFFIRFFI